MHLFCRRQLPNVATIQRALRVLQRCVKFKFVFCPSAPLATNSVLLKPCRAPLFFLQSCNWYAVSNYYGAFGVCSSTSLTSSGYPYAYYSSSSVSWYCDGFTVMRDAGATMAGVDIPTTRI